MRYWRSVRSPQCSTLRAGTFHAEQLSAQEPVVPNPGVIMQFNRIVVGIDFSANSLAASRWVAHHFAPDADVVLVHVVAPPDVLSLPRSEERRVGKGRGARVWTAG